MTTDQSGVASLEKLKSFCETFAERMLTEYAAYIDQPRVLSRSPKEVNDAIWGTIKLHPIEVALLDSPLVQRLRFIRQLGVVHWIYPGAIHTRFEHTLGVLHQVQQLITAVNEAAPDSARPIDEKHTAVLRLCALLHDIGHGVFSHVSEHALGQSDALRLALTKFSSEKRLDKVQLSEVFAYYVVESPAFANLLLKALSNVPHKLDFKSSINDNVDFIAELIKNSIIGKSISDQVPLMHELISGPIDADKLDYFVRDSKMAGIPSVLDISRLTQKITVKSMSEHDLPVLIGSKVRSGLPHYYIFGLKWSGAAVLDELHLARILLYAKIYRHQKVLAVEAMVEALFALLIQRSDITMVDIVVLAYSLTDDQMLWSSSREIFRLAGVAEPEEYELAFIDDILQRLRDRRLYVKALAVRVIYPNDNWAEYEAQVKGLQRLVEDLRNHEQSRNFRTLLVEEVEKIVRLIPTAVPRSYDIGLISKSIIVTSKSIITGGTEIDRSFIFHGGKPVTYRDLSGVNRHAWADAYDFSTAPAVIFCPKEIAQAAYVGAERLIREKYDVILPTSAMELSKQDVSGIDKLKKMLLKKDYYFGSSFDLRPKPDRLERADMQRYLDEITNRLEALDEPPNTAVQRRPLTLRSRIEYWLSQFESEADIECAMVLLKSVRVLGREDTKATLKSFVRMYPEFAGATVLLLGDLKDSSAIQGYLSQDAQEIFPRVMTVSEAASKKIETPVLFLDDFISSGGQVSDILGNWFDKDELKKKELEEQRELFGDVEREYLKNRKIGFVFVAGWKSGVDAAADACKELGLTRLMREAGAFGLADVA